jgi:hypothetical protein
MCRPGSSFVHQVIAGALVALAVGGCGKGLYTHASQFKDNDGSGGGVTDPGTGTGTGGGISTSPDAYAGDGGSSRNSDVAPKLDAAPGACETNWISRGTDREIKCLEATLTIPKDSIKSGGEWPVTLSLWSQDGILSLPNEDGFPQDYGTRSPIYMVSVSPEIFWSSVTLRIRAIPDSDIPPQRFGLAYVNTSSKCWIKPDSSSYDSANKQVVGTVNLNNGSGTYYFTPVETCEDTGEPCQLGLTCKGGACQK